MVGCMVIEVLVLAVLVLMLMLGLGLLGRPAPFLFEFHAEESYAPAGLFADAVEDEEDFLLLVGLG